MAGDESTDILMMFVYKGQGIEAEGQDVTSSKRDPLLDGFERGRFFETENVDLGFSAPDTTTQGGAQNKAIDGQPINVSRQIDSASPRLMEFCFNSTTLDKAVIVKRRAAGTEKSGLVYLRLDFTKVLITKINWSDSTVVKESITFIYKEVKMTYRPQMASGELGPQSSVSYAIPADPSK